MPTSRSQTMGQDDQHNSAIDSQSPQYRIHEAKVRRFVEIWHKAHGMPRMSDTHDIRSVIIRVRTK